MTDKPMLTCFGGNDRMTNANAGALAANMKNIATPISTPTSGNEEHVDAQKPSDARAPGTDEHVQLLYVPSPAFREQPA